MWKLTLRYLGRALVQSKRAVVAVVIGAFIAGSIATVKSLIESRIIAAVADVMNGSGEGSIWSRALGSVGSSDSDWVVDLANRLFSGVEFRWGIVTYVAVSLLAVLLAVVTTSSRESISRRLFSGLFEAGVSKAFTHSALPVEVEDEPGGLAGAVQQGARAVSGAYAFLVEAGQYLFSLVAVFLVLIDVNIGFALLSLGVTAVLAAISWLQGRRLSKRRERYDDRRRELFGFTGQVLANRDVLLAHEQKSRYIGRLGTSSHELGTIDKDLSVRESVYIGSVNFIQDLGLIAILGVVLVAATRGTNVNAVGDAYFYVSLFARIMTPIRNMLSGYDDVRRSMSTSRTLLALLANDDVAVTRPATADSSSSWEAEFSGVSFAYVPDEVAVENCSFGIPTGGVTLIVGRSGAGKTTIARMLLKFLTPDRGEVKVRGRSTCSWDREELLQEMSYLSQTGHVIEGTVQENLFAPADASEESLCEALRTVRLASNDSDALQVLRQQATRLSEGQKQRLALARILVDRAPIVTLDEPLAGVDAFTFAEVRGPMTEWMADPGRTVVMVSHRLEFVSAATHIIVLGERGRVVEQGAPADLRTRPGGLFASLLDAGRHELAVGG
ncbi:ABC transporter ATP-binding protein [Kribbella sp. NPDC026611]|uniref:ABC transporter ATP-binding protein n=1 Tax=Kribbella sp. NPDC026611 TaxID=3154911 RepID=UPI0033DA32B2